MSNAPGSGKSPNVSAMVAIALSSAEKVVKELNSAHSKTSKSSPSGGASPRVQSQADRFHGSSKK